MADVMRIGAGLLGLKSENMHAIAAASRFLRGQGSHKYAKESLQLSESDRLGKGRGRVNLPPRRLVWRFWEVWRV